MTETFTKPKIELEQTSRRGGRLADLLAVVILLVFPAIFLSDVLFGGKVLLPVDDLFAMKPWRDFAAQFGISAPHNHLIADMIVQNLSWKTFAKDTLLQGQLPLWNPYLLGGVPFLAAGQYAVLYPLGALFYVLPVPVAYGWFTLLHLFLGGLFMYLFLRIIDVPRLGALVGGISFAFSAFIVVSFVWPMVISTAIWLPLLVALVELTIRGIGPERNAIVAGRYSPWLWPLLGALVVAMQFLSGHMEISFYVLFTAGFYTLGRLGLTLWRSRRLVRTLAAAVALLGMVALGGGLAAVQIVPFAEAISANFRAGFVSYEDVIGYALPTKRALSFAIPDIFGNPAVHTYRDLSDGAIKPVQHLDRSGNEVRYVADWDRKNYVEGASYIGLLPLFLMAVALLYRRNRYTLIFAALAVWSLLLAFGTPLYRLFFYGIPGFDQLHTPFRWLFPYTFCATALAGIGAGCLARRRSDLSSLRQVALALGGLAAVAFVALAALVMLAPFRELALQMAGQLFTRTPRLQDAFGDPLVFISFQWRNALVFLVFLLASAAVCIMAARQRPFTDRVSFLRGRRIWPVLAVAVVVADLYVFGADFNTKSDPALLDFVPPSVQFLKNDPELFRIVSVGEQDVLTPDTAMRFGLQDARGYDTIIPRQYVDFWSQIEDPRGYLIYSKIHKLREPASLQSPLLNLLNVKYVLTTEQINLPRYTHVYRGEINIYRNEDVLPRAFIVSDPARLQFANDHSSAVALLGRPDFDPRYDLVLEDSAASRQWPAKSEPAVPPTIVRYAANEVALRADAPSGGYLVLTDSYFPGWEATVGGLPSPIYRADGNFRAVYVPPGSHDVLFRYRPNSFRAGLALTGVSLGLILLGIGYFGRPRGLFAGYTRGPLQRVAKNSLMPMTTSIMNKLISAAFAMYVLRALGVEGVGKYGFAIVIAAYFEIFTNFGLNTLLTREVAKDTTSGNRYLSNTTLLRLVLWLLSLPVVAGVILLWRAQFGLDRDTSLAIVLLIVALVPGHVATGLSSLFNAHERMEYPALVSIFTTLLTVGLGMLALLSGYGFVGLAAVSVLVNLVTAGIFFALVCRVLSRPRLQPDTGQLRGLLGQAAPLMLNHLLATVFFRIDVMLLQPMKGDKAVGYYRTAYSFLDALNIIPSAFTFAVFPLMSRYADSAKGQLVRVYDFALKGLLLISLPITVGTFFLAEPIVLLFGGPGYLPEGAIALQVLIWFLPLSYVNSMTQYVLIAVNQQRFITVSFIGATAFNIVGNLLVIPQYSYAGAAFVTILSEIVLLVPFWYAVRRYVGQARLLTLAVRPVMAAGFMGVVLWRLQGYSPLFLIPLAAVVYSLALLALRTFDEEDKLLLRRLIRREG